MSNNLFTSVQTEYDPKNKPVHLCQGDDGFYVYKPSSGFKSRSFAKKDDEALLAIFERQRHDGHAFASYLPGEQDEQPVEKKKKRKE